MGAAASWSSAAALAFLAALPPLGLFSLPAAAGAAAAVPLAAGGASGADSAARFLPAGVGREGEEAGRAVAGWWCVSRGRVPAERAPQRRVPLPGGGTAARRKLAGWRYAWRGAGRAWRAGSWPAQRAQRAGARPRFSFKPHRGVGPPGPRTAGRGLLLDVSHQLCGGLPRLQALAWGGERRAGRDRGGAGSPRSMSGAPRPRPQCSPLTTGCDVHLALHAAAKGPPRVHVHGAAALVTSHTSRFMGAMCLPTAGLQGAAALGGRSGALRA